MKIPFSIKVLVARFGFALGIWSLWFFYKQHLGDYVIMTLVTIPFLGIFTISDILLKTDEVLIKKNYFWGLVWFRKNLKYDQIISISSKEYTATQNDSIDWWTLMPETTIKWKVTKIVYKEEGMEKDIEVKIRHDDLITIKTFITK